MIYRKQLQFDNKLEVCHLKQVMIELSASDDMCSKYTLISDWESLVSGETTREIEYYDTMPQEMVESGFTDETIDKYFKRYEVNCLQLHPEIKPQKWIE